MSHKLRYIVSFELGVGSLSRERPDQRFALLVAVLLPSLDIASQRLACLASGVQALAREDADLDFGHVQPTRMLWRVVEANPAQQLGGLLLTERIDEAFLEVGVEIVQDQMQTPRRFVGRVEQVLDEGGEIGLAASLGDDDSAVNDGQEPLFFDGEQRFLPT